MLFTARTTKRAWCIVRGGWYALTMVFVLSGPILDAAVEAASVDRVTHVESESTTRCSAGHDEFCCQLCRLNVFDGRRPRQIISVLNPAHHRDTAVGHTLSFRSSRVTPHGPRAPPSH